VKWRERRKGSDDMQAVVEKVENVLHQSWAAEIVGEGGEMEAVAASWMGKML
jgi:hypothetical protein